MDALRAAQQSAVGEFVRTKSGDPAGKSAETLHLRQSGAVQKPDQGKNRFSEEQLVDAVDQANELSQMFDRGLKFEYRKEADIYQVSVIDTSRDEVVRKIPPDEVVRFIERIKDMFGAMLDVQA